MVKNLTKHGIISNSEEAIEMASRMYNVQKKDEGTTTDEGMTTIDSEGSNGQKIKDEMKSMIDKRLQYFLQKHNSMMFKEFQEIWTKLNQVGPHIDNKLQQIRQELQTMAPQQQVMAPQQQVMTPQQQVIKPENNEKRPRTGKFNEEDVSVEKFFYCGDK